MKTKILIAIASIIFLVSGATAQDSNTSVLWNTSDQVIQSGNTLQSEAFAADSLANLSAEIDLDNNDSLSTTIFGYNSTAETGNQTFDLVDGTQEYTIDSFSENTSTYMVEFTAGENGSVSLLDAEITGTEGNTSVSGAAPGGGLMTGNFFASILNPFTALGNWLNGIASWIGGVFA
jgi:hypothetical protein